MSTWKIRHAGSQQPPAELTPTQILEGVREGHWDPADEVQGPGERTWQALEAHPQFAEAVEALEPEAPLHHDEETHLDMNPLIDVALVLLIFFILTTTYESLRKELPSPPPTPKGEKSKAVSEKDLNQVVIRASVLMESGKPVIRINDAVTPEEELQAKLEATMKATGMKKLAVEIGPGVPWRSFIALQDAATGAKIEETIRIVRKSQLAGNP